MYVKNFFITLLLFFYVYAVSMYKCIFYLPMLLVKSYLRQKKKLYNYKMKKEADDKKKTTDIP